MAFCVDSCVGLLLFSFETGWIQRYNIELKVVLLTLYYSENPTVSKEKLNKPAEKANKKP